jgi:hypothetical protein
VTLPQQSRYPIKYALLSSGFMQVPIHETGEGSAPAGQVWTPPPQQVHSEPLRAQ